jgi:hypothetical protein
MSQFHLTESSFSDLAKGLSAMDARSESADDLAKRGARKSAADMALIQELHDGCARLSDNGLCGFSLEAAAKAKADPELAKRGSRHSKTDLQKIREAHDALCALGAKCMDAAGADEKQPVEEPQEDEV